MERTKIMYKQPTQPRPRYGVYDNILSGKIVNIKTRDITPLTWNEYRIDLYRMFLDCIEQENFQKTKIRFEFDTGNSVYLTTEDALTNICMWGFIVNAGKKIKPYHLFFEEEGVTKKSIKKYIDKYCIIPNRYDIPSPNLNEIIYKSLSSLKFVDDFGMFFNNSVNLEDFVELANACPEFDMLLSKDYSHLPPDQMNDVTMKDTNRLIELILDSKKYMGREHCLINAFRAGVGVKPKQFRETVSNIGIKPNGEGGIAPHSIDASFLNGGLSRIAWMIAESSVGRQAQILSKKNTADSGAFARIVGLNCVNTFLYRNPKTGEIDPDYDCHTRNYVEICINSLIRLEQFRGRYFRIKPNGMEFNIGDDIDKDHPVLGKNILLRSPITCASFAKGLGICRKCYGELFIVNSLLNIGKLAAEAFTMRLTQAMLSAKHLLEAKISKPEWNDVINWCLNVEENVVSLNSDFIENSGGRKWSLVIDYDDINTETLFNINDTDDDEASGGESLEDSLQYINKIRFVSDDGETQEFFVKDYVNLYITPEFSMFIQKNGYNDVDTDEIRIPVEKLIQEEIRLFEIGISNDDMSNKLKNIVTTINLKDVTEKFDINTFLDTLLDKMSVCGINDIASVHAEIIIANQVRNSENILLPPNWDVPNQKNYKVVTLRRALTDNPSVAISLQFDNIAKTLYTPLTFKKTKASRLDLFYHVQPQVYIKEEPESRAANQALSSPYVKVEP